MVSFSCKEVVCSVLEADSSLGTGAVYSYDPVGSYEREACRAAGAAQSLIQPFLDNQVRSFTYFASLLYTVVLIRPDIL